MTTLHFPPSAEHAAAHLATAAGAAVRAGATDLQECRHLGLVAASALVDLSRAPDLQTITVTAAGGLRIGAMVRIAALAADARVAAAYPGLAQAAGGLATPQIRAQATVGGNLLQHNRCWYYRTDQFSCLCSGGSRCLAREGDHLYHACIDQGPCIAPHPSTLAMALLAFDATVEVAGSGEDRSMAALMGSPGDPTRSHTLEAGSILQSIVLPPPVVGARSGYLRTIHRSRAEWPLVEALAYVSLAGERILAARLVLGGVANRPLRLSSLEARLAGQPLRDARPIVAAIESLGSAAALPQTAYKIPLMTETLLDALDLAARSAPATALSGETP